MKEKKFGNVQNVKMNLSEIDIFKCNEKYLKI